ncbi:hypothetical protein [Adonisia turfae]|uniref:Uncharacterized protein n=1 Tax=Adonisia turfae CCMR0081 TaxID=2292702 RepID=A0A6M0RH89_9CYAN|nr:hypothetical protein [Adonisia turfae]NEZ54981.1 hypothetical protein [Adonisia turfae CCMR0081]
MPHNRAERERAVREKYEFVVFGGEYSVFNALLAAVDGIITGGNFTYAFLKNEARNFGIDLATALSQAGLNPLNETLYFDKFVFNNWEKKFGIRITLPNKFVPYVAARKRETPKRPRDVASIDGRFRAVSDLVGTLGYGAGFPNFHEANHGNGVVYGTILIKANYVEWRDIPAADLGNPGDIGARFRAVNDWAGKNSYKAGFPNFHQADYGNGVVYGTFLLKDNATEWRDIPAADLGNPGDIGARFRAVNDWAVKNGYRGGFPNFHQADYGNGVVYGTILIKHEAADWRDISVSELQT